MGSGRNMEEFRTPYSFKLLDRNNGPFKHIAKDLLKGARDLQESLIMLNKLQEAPDYMSQMKKMQSKKAERGISERVEIQRPWLSTDGSSRDCFEELKTAIRNSLARHNLLPLHEQTYFDRRLADWASDIPSTSSGQSSVVRSISSLYSTQSSFSEKGPHIKKKGPSLVAKLMGLEELPAKSVVQKTLKEQLDIEQSLSPQRPEFDIVLTKLWNSQPKKQSKIDSNQRTLKEILETMQFKGLLKSSYIDTKRRSVTAVSPIVLMKPLHVPEPDPEVALQSIVRENETLNGKVKLKKVKLKPDITTVSNYQTGTESEGNSIKILAQETEAKELVKVVNQIQEEEPPSRKEKKLTRVKDREGKTKLEGSSKRRVSRPAPHTHTPDTAAKDESVKPSAKKSVSKLPDQEKAVPSNPRKAGSRSVCGKDPSAKQRIITSNNKPKSSNQQQSDSSPKVVSKQTMKSANNGSMSPKKKRSVLQNSPKANKTVNHNNSGSKESIRRIADTQTNDPVETETRFLVAEQLTQDERGNVSDSPNEEHYQESCEETSSITITDESHIDESVSNKPESQLKVLLLSNPLFINQAEEQFHPRQNSTKPLLPTTAIYDSEAKLYLDYAKEYIGRRSQVDSLTSFSFLPSYIKGTKFCLSLDLLVEEVCEGVETLRSYSEVACENGSTAYIYTLLKRDLMSKEVESSIWEFGWKCEFSVDEAELVVNDVEQLIVNELIEEVFA